jgi:Ca2+:H+ antiporter
MFPALAMLLFAVAAGLGLDFTPSVGGLLFAVVLLAILFGTVFAAVHHAEVIAGRIGEPYGTLLLTLAVTIIEVALIATIMLGDKPQPALARDTVFAVVISCATASPASASSSAACATANRIFRSRVRTFISACCSCWQPSR